jgi:aspartate aminotransferase
MKFVNDQIKNFLSNSSMIRKMFEAGIELKKKYGADKVYDFSLGNPDLPVPAAVQKSIENIAAHSLEPFAHGYMPNAGFPFVREKLAQKLSIEQSNEIPASNVIITCGAAGGLNVFFRTILEKDDEVIVPAPYFVEYGFYTANFGGKLIPVESKDFTFELDLEKLEAAFNEKTRAVIINSPHNPTGQIYTREEMTALGEIIKRKSAEFNHVIYLIADEPYRFLNYDGAEIPSVFDVCDNSVVIGSYSKTLSLAGERIGYIAVNPKIENAAELVNGLILSNRILGFVNAPAMAQRIIADCLDSEVDMNVYRTRRNLMADVLSEAGLEFTMPKGAFYFFVKSPTEDEKIFVEVLTKHCVLAVPGSGFGKKGYVRFAFCVSEKVIENSRESIKAAVAEIKSQN